MYRILLLKCHLEHHPWTNLKKIVFFLFSMQSLLIHSWNPNHQNIRNPRISFNQILRPDSMSMWSVLNINNSRYQSWQVSVSIWSIELSISYISLKYFYRAWISVGVCASFTENLFTLAWKTIYTSG